MLIIAILTLGANIVAAYILYRTYRAIVDYTKETKRLADIAARQADALPRPLIVPYTALDSRGKFSIVPPTLWLQNQGDAPATRIEYEIRYPDGAVATGACAFLNRDVLDTKIDTARLVDGWVIVTRCETISGGVEMVTRATIEDLQIHRLDVPRPLARSQAEPHRIDS